MIYVLGIIPTSLPVSCLTMAPRNFGETVRKPLIEVNMDSNQNQAARDELPPEGNFKISSCISLRLSRINHMGEFQKNCTFLSHFPCVKGSGCCACFRNILRNAGTWGISKDHICCCTCSGCAVWSKAVPDWNQDTDLLYPSKSSFFYSCTTGPLDVRTSSAAE